MMLVEITPSQGLLWEK